MKHYTIYTLALLFLVSCNQPVPTTSVDYEKYRIPYPYVPDIVNLELKADIGRRLFFFKQDSVSCASCHAAQFGFTAGEQQSKGKDHDLPPVKSPSTIGLHGSNMLLWNGAASGTIKNYPFNTLDTSKLTYNNWYGSVAAIHQVLFANVAHEQTFSRDSIMENDSDIMDKFRLAYPGVIESRLCEIEDIAECIAAFQILHLNPTNSKQQQFIRREISLSDSELSGWRLFDQNCEGCHAAPYMGADRFVRTNTPPFINDIHDGSNKVNKGRMSMTGYPEDSLKFRVMRLQTNIVDHGCFGFSCEENDLTTFVQNHNSRRVLTNTEIYEIVSFLHACRDEDLIKIK